MYWLIIYFVVLLFSAIGLIISNWKGYSKLSVFFALLILTLFLIFIWRLIVGILSMFI